MRARLYLAMADGGTARPGTFDGSPSAPRNSQSGEDRNVWVRVTLADPPRQRDRGDAAVVDDSVSWRRAARPPCPKADCLGGF